MLHVYDEIVAEADDKKAAKVAKLIADTMREAHAVGSGYAAGS